MEKFQFDKKFRKRVNDFNQDMKNISRYYIVTPNNEVFTYADKMVSPYNKLGGTTHIISKDFFFHEDIKMNILLDSIAIFEHLKTVKDIEEYVFIEGIDIGVMKNDVFSRIGWIIPDGLLSLEKIEERERIVKELEGNQNKIYWLNDDELDDLLSHKKHIGVNIDGMYFRISKGTLAHVRKTDKIGILMKRGRMKEVGALLYVTLICQRKTFLSTHKFKAVDYKDNR